MEHRDDARVRLEVQGRDLDEGLEFFSDGYGGDGLTGRITDVDFAYRHTATGDSRLTLRSNKFLGEMAGAVTPVGEHIVHWLTRGTASMDVGHEEHRLGVGSPVIVPKNQPFRFRYEDYEQSLVHIDDSVVFEVAAEREGVLPGSLVFDHASPLTEAAKARWGAAVRRIAATYLDPAAPPLLRLEAARFAAASMLEVFPHTSTIMQEALLAPRNASLREAVEYLHINAHLPITPSDVARQVGVTPRGLQQAFSRHLDTTPTEYLRGIRLERVRDELRISSPDQVTVAEVARRWAFSHLGRFSGSYVQRFGEYPRDTLLRG